MMKWVEEYAEAEKMFVWLIDSELMCFLGVESWRSKDQNVLLSLNWIELLRYYIYLLNGILVYIFNVVMNLHHTTALWFNNLASERFTSNKHLYRSVGEMFGNALGKWVITID